MATNKIKNPVQGDTIIFKKTAKDTDGKLLEFQMLVEPSASGPPQHIHPKTKEQFEVLSGKIQAKIGDQMSASPFFGPLKSRGFRLW